MQGHNTISRGWCGALPSVSHVHIEVNETLSEYSYPNYPTVLRFCWFMEKITNFLHDLLSSTGPAKTRLGLIAMLILTVVIASHGSAHAQTLSGNGLLNGIYNHIVIDTLPFFSNSFNIADMIFGGVGTMSVMVALLNYLTEYRTLSGSAHMILRLVIQIAIPWTFLKIGETIISLWNVVSTNVGSYIIGSGTMNLTPDGIFKIGASLMVSMLTHVSWSALQSMVKQLTLIDAVPYFLILIISLFCAAVILVSFTLLAVEMLVAFAQGYIQGNRVIVRRMSRRAGSPKILRQESAFPS